MRLPLDRSPDADAADRLRRLIDATDQHRAAWERDEGRATIARRRYVESLRRLTEERDRHQAPT